MTFELNGHIIKTEKDLISHLEEKIASPGYRPPASDLGYCLCGTVWNLDAIEAMGFLYGTCPDCGEDAVAIERSDEADA